MEILKDSRIIFLLAIATFLVLFLFLRLIFIRHKKSEISYKSGEILNNSSTWKTYKNLYVIFFILIYLFFLPYLESGGRARGDVGSPEADVVLSISFIIILTFIGSLLHFINKLTVSGIINEINSNHIKDKE